jgi:predicted deacylase
VRRAAVPRDVTLWVVPMMNPDGAALDTRFLADGSDPNRAAPALPEQRAVYDYAVSVRPNLAVYFRVPIEVSLDRLLARRVKLKFYEAGLDMGWSTNALESFRIFQGKVLDEYDQLVNEFGMEVIDARGSITDQQRVVRNVISQHLNMTHVEATDDELV